MAWKLEISQRKKLKTHIPTQRVEQPMKLGEMPAWKKELAERRKSRRGSSIDNAAIEEAKAITTSTIPAPVTVNEDIVTASPAISSSTPKVEHTTEASEEVENIPPWKREFQMKKKRTSIVTVKGIYFFILNFDYDSKF